MASEALIVLCTFPDGEKADEVARTLVGEKLAACVNLLPQVRSIYRWEGEVSDDAEVLAVIKTTGVRFDSLRQRVVELHPYDCPEVVAVRIERGHEPYLAWLAASTRG
jgi:periplasmic divalent cation tolerance protein